MANEDRPNLDDRIHKGVSVDNPVSADVKVTVDPAIAAAYKGEDVDEGEVREQARKDAEDQRAAERDAGAGQARGEKPDKDKSGAATTADAGKSSKS